MPAVAEVTTTFRGFTPQDGHPGPRRSRPERRSGAGLSPGAEGERRPCELMEAMISKAMLSTQLRSLMPASSSMDCCSDHHTHHSKDVVYRPPSCCSCIE